MLLGELTDDYSENHMKRVKCGQNALFSMIKQVVK
jgi:hypothetical protein